MVIGVPSFGSSDMPPPQCGEFPGRNGKAREDRAPGLTTSCPGTITLAKGETGALEALGAFPREAQEEGLAGCLGARSGGIEVPETRLLLSEHGPQKRGKGFDGASHHRIMKEEVQHTGSLAGIQGVHIG
jgi:hypothetical protein